VRLLLSKALPILWCRGVLGKSERLNDWAKSTMTVRAVTA